MNIDNTNWEWVGDREVGERSIGTESAAGTGFEPSRRTFLRGSVAVGAAVTVGGLASAAAASETATHVMFTGNAKDGTVSLSDADTYEDIRTIPVYPDDDKEDVLDDALDAVSPVLLNALTRRTTSNTPTSRRTAGRCTPRGVTSAMSSLSTSKPTRSSGKRTSTGSAPTTRRFRPTGGISTPRTSLPTRSTKSTPRQGTSSRRVMHTTCPTATSSIACRASPRNC